MDALESVLSLVVTLGILVTIHEYGHYWVARRCGVKVLRFSVGFGKPLYTWENREGTQFCIAAVPLGGYVKMLDEREASVAEEEKQYAFNRKSPWQRIAIASAGPIANFLFAIFAYWLMFVVGFNVIKPTVGGVVSGSVAAEAGIESGYELVSVGDRMTPGWKDVSIALANYVGESARLDVTARYQGSSTEERFSLELGESLVVEPPANLIESVGIEPYRPLVPPVMDTIVADGAAERGGMVKGDLVTSANGNPIKDWFEFVAVIQASPGEVVEVVVERPVDESGSVTTVLELTPDSVEGEGEGGVLQGRLGVGVQPFEYPEEMIRTVQLGPVDAVSRAFDQTLADTSMTLNAIRKMVVGLLSLENLSGPITIAQVASQSISSGLEDFLGFLALLSVSLGVLNLLPIPVLDGGHIVYYLLEAVRGKPIPESWQLFGLKVGLSLVVALMFIAFYNDIMRL